MDRSKTSRVVSPSSLNAKAREVLLSFPRHRSAPCSRTDLDSVLVVLGLKLDLVLLSSVIPDGLGRGEGASRTEGGS